MVRNLFKEYDSHILNISEDISLAGAYITWTGYLKAYPNYMCWPRILDDFFMLYVAKGKGLFQCNGTTYCLAQEDIFFLLPGIVHSYQTDSQDLLELWWIGFKGPYVPKLLSDLNISADRCLIKTHSNKMIFNLFESTYLITSRASAAVNLKCTAMLYEIFGELFEACSVTLSSYSGEQKIDHSIERALSYIETHYSKDISIDDIACYSGLSRSYLATKFKQEVGCSPSQQLAKIRLNQAIYYLNHSDLSIDQIAEYIGIKDSQYFSRFFKKICKYLLLTLERDIV